MVLTSGFRLFFEEVWASTSTLNLFEIKFGKKKQVKKRKNAKTTIFKRILSFSFGCPFIIKRIMPQINLRPQPKFIK